MITIAVIGDGVGIIGIGIAGTIVGAITEAIGAGAVTGIVIITTGTGDSI